MKIMSEVWDRHAEHRDSFGLRNKAEALELEAKALDGDDRAQLRMAHIYGAAFPAYADYDTGEDSRWVRGYYPTEKDFYKSYELDKTIVTPVYGDGEENQNEIVGFQYRINQNAAQHFEALSKAAGQRHSYFYKTEYNSGKKDDELYNFGGNFLLDKYYNNPSKALEWARKGNSSAAGYLAKYYGEKHVTQKIDKWHGSEDIQVPNPNYDEEKADYWTHAERILSGRGTSREKKLFIEDFFTNLETKDALYCAGYTLIHSPLKDFERGIGFLKHAVNLGSSVAARELGEIYEKYDAEYAPDAQQDLKASYLWYKIAADMGHPNGKARCAYLLKRHPELKAESIDQAAQRNPEKSYGKDNPSAVWKILIKEPDLSFVRDHSTGSHTERMQRAVHLLNQQVSLFDETLGSLESGIRSIVEKSSALQEEQNQSKRAAQAAVHHNRKLDEQIAKENRLLKLSRERWIKETTTRAVMGMGMLLLTGGASGAITLGTMLQGKNLFDVTMALNVERSAGYGVVALNEMEYRREIAANLEAMKIDSRQFEAEIGALSRKMLELARTKPILELRKDSTASERLYKGYLRRQLFNQGLEDADNLEYFVKQEGIGSLDDFLSSFSGRVGEALTNLCYGFADTNDLHIVMAFSDSLKDKASDPHEKAIKKYVEELVKPRIDDYAPKASRVDVIKEIVPDFVPGASDPMQVARAQVDQSSSRALAGLVASNFSTVGGQRIDELFAFYLHRHGGKTLRATRVNDGQVSDMTEPKKLHVMSEDQKEEFIDRVTHSYRVGRVDLPDVGNLFLRICGAEYFVPQNIVTAGKNNSFAQNPQAPVAYPMVNDVINDFIEKMSLSPIMKYRDAIGGKLDNLIAQSFIDFFAILGQLHADRFEKERTALAEAFDSGTYGTRYQMCYRKITDDACNRYELFKDIFNGNLQKTLQISTETENKQLNDQLEKLKKEGVSALEPENLVMPGTPEALQDAIVRNRRYENMRVPSDVKRR